MSNLKGIKSLDSVGMQFALECADFSITDKDPVYIHNVCQLALFMIKLSFIDNSLVF